MKTAWKHTSWTLVRAARLATSPLSSVSSGGVGPGALHVRCAVQDELDKWNAAFQGKTYFCGDLDANPLHGDEVMIPPLKMATGLRLF